VKDRDASHHAGAPNRADQPDPNPCPAVRPSSSSRITTSRSNGSRPRTKITGASRASTGGGVASSIGRERQAGPWLDRASWWKAAGRTMRWRGLYGLIAYCLSMSVRLFSCLGLFAV
jgi:hypothetical protein